MMKFVGIALIIGTLLTGCVGKIVSAPFKATGEVIDIVLP